MSRPRFVTLRLLDPRMGASNPHERDLILLVQKRLRDVDPTGLFDCQTSAAVQRWQWQQGAPAPNGAIAPAELQILLGYVEKPAEWTTRAAERITDGAWSPIPNPVAERCSEPRGEVKLTIIPRKAVGLRAPTQRVAANHAGQVPFVGHWQGPGRGAVGLDNAFAQLRGFQHHHMVTLGWSDIGYNWAIPRGAPAGTVIELRGRGVRGAHCGDNVGNGYPGVLVMLGQDDDGPAADQLLTLEVLRAAESWGRATAHFEWSPTSCPGPALTAWIRANR